MKALIFNFSCSSTNEDAPEEITYTNALIGDWKIKKYVFIDNVNGQEIGSTNLECSGKNLYHLKANNFLNIRMYKSTQYGVCLDTPTNDDGQWTYNSGSKMITFYGDVDYKVKSISSTQLEIESFDEGYVDYFDKDFNNDGIYSRLRKFGGEHK
ncbi:hypothetical protein [Chryseobacterium luquanense]|uniref:Lipocalin-like domain-containing protein n=1 Tax=Chryseobacterium luquanense TaxID=2983766 RepID=A0ABT3Y1Y7_9FLAO|nr:hypothetical protein [Chryseobacterium luquanense]MCX8532162.1 hypothetical protein [Chryseobacterium luquanense]